MKNLTIVFFIGIIVFTNLINTSKAQTNNLECSFVNNSNLSNGSCSYGFIDPYCDECGLRFNEPNTRIVGGIEAAPHSWPSMALVVFKYQFYYTIGSNTFKTERVSFCGGTLIDRNTVLTASHCFVNQVIVSYDFQQFPYTVVPNNFYPTYESMYTVYLGLHNNAGVFDKTDITPGIAVSISSFKRHPSYDKITNLNDIAIIKLSQDVTFNCFIQPACLPNPIFNTYPNGENISTWAVGWGRLTDSGSTPDNLYNVKLTIYSSLFCRYVSLGTKKDWSKQICAGEYSGGKDTCQGDSGGPIFLKDNVNGVSKYILVGITSYGDGCGEQGYPGIYTRVSAYMSWISESSSSTNLFSLTTIVTPKLNLTLSSNKTTIENSVNIGANIHNNSNHLCILFYFNLIYFFVNLK